MRQNRISLWLDNFLFKTLKFRLSCFSPLFSKPNWLLWLFWKNKLIWKTKKCGAQWDKCLLKEICLKIIVSQFVEVSNVTLIMFFFQMSYIQWGQCFIVSHAFCFIVPYGHMRPVFDKSAAVLADFEAKQKRFAQPKQIT